ncbi:MAG: alpha/beta hydrolase, partial [Brachybacterium sp.]|nr:alpha/beta hydrolase [Brachybacterium sp.]
MPYGYLATVLLWGTVTAVLLRPPRRPLWLARLVHLLGVLLNEVPALLVLALGLATAQAVVLDQVHRSGVGVLALLLAALVVAGACRLQWDVTRARGAVERTIGVPAGSRPSRWAWLFPLSLRPRKVERVRDLPYAPGGREHLLDLYRRRDLTAPAPVLIHVHGGGYSSGHKRVESGPLKHRLAQHGWVVLSANYGLRPEVDWPGHLIDAKRVIAWVHEHAGEHGLDPSRIVMAGSSAGAHLAVHCALTANDPRLQPGFEEVDTHLAAAVGLYGHYGRYYGAQLRGPAEVPSGGPPGRGRASDRAVPRRSGQLCARPAGAGARRPPPRRLRTRHRLRRAARCHARVRRLRLAALPGRARRDRALPRAR